jgi:predicted permease
MTLLQDFRFAIRSLRSHLGTAAFATLTLAIGLGAALSIYAVIDAVLLRELPYPQADRLVEMHELSADGKPMALAYPNYADLVANDAFASTAFYGGGDGPVSSGSTTRRAYATFAGGEFFHTMAATAQLGRTFDASERGHVAVISHALWQSLMQGRADVVGQPIDVAGDPATIVGVMPPGFDFPEGTAVWTPFFDDPGQSRTAHNWSAVARLRDGATLEQVRLAAGTLATRLVREYGESIDLRAFDVAPLAEAMAAPVRSALLLLAAGTLFLLLIAVTNAANLLLALNGARSRELAVRAALGATRARLMRQIFAESVLIATAAAALAIALAWSAVRVFVHAGAVHLPRANEVGIGASAIAISVVTALVIAAATTAAVLFAQQRSSTTSQLRESGRGQSAGRAHMRLRAAMIVGQTALTTVLLVGAGLLGRSFMALLAIDPGYRADSAIAVELSRPWTRDTAVAAETARRYEALIGQLRDLPGVSAVGGVNALPLGGDGADGAFWDGNVASIANAPKPIGYAEFRVASAGYFDAVGIRLLAGRAFDQRDRADSEPVAVISAAAARATWGDADPIGRRIQYGNMDGDERVLTIVGVVGDVHERRLDRAPKGTVYVDLPQRPITAAGFNLVVRSSLPLATLTPSVRAILERAASDTPHSIAPLAEKRAAALADRRLGLVLLAAFAAVAFLLAVGGLYGLMAFAVGQRQHEFAVRQALGATRRSIAERVLRSGIAIAGAGVAAGVLAAAAGATMLHGLLYGVPALDLSTFGGVALVLLCTALLACALPALRACAVPPRDALA